ncbi:MAG: bifunctional phosphopantothenoylcysteine decarboxylase/phosphopantothenate--cysteine ligase CoaBC [bacterium]|nr:bifunctional phosphopantothenoylcysteine decarboxylase/phosphopantothenate--cysteine ligase CoaBC [bacterium]
MSRIVFGVTGGIAAYKTLDVVRYFRKQHQDIDIICILTEDATKFIQPLSFSTLSGNDVLTDLFAPRKTPVHIELAKSDLIIVAPATYNFIGKIANGIADDLLSCVIAASKCPVLFVPSMNSAMWENPILMDNIKKLKKYGYYFLEPDMGALATLDVGKGRFPCTEFIVEEALCLLNTSKKLSGKKVVITAGKTESYLDPVRCITNNSSGTMGYELARAAKFQGADVTLISGSTAITPPNVEVIKIKTIEELKNETLKCASHADILIMAAAVVDYVPVSYSARKIKSSRNSISIKFQVTQDILKLAKTKNKELFTVGFALESDKHLENAKIKLKSKLLDLIIVNDVSSISALDTQLTLVNKEMKIRKLPLLSKKEAASKVLHWIIEEYISSSQPF